MDQVTAKQSRCVVSWFFSAALSVWEQYYCGFFVRSSWSCISTKPICLSMASLSCVKQPSLWGNANTGAAVTFFCNFAKAYVSSVGKWSKCFMFPLFQLSIRWAAICPSLGTNRCYILHKPKHDFSSSNVRGSFKLRTASVEWGASANVLAFIPCPEIVHFLRKELAHLQSSTRRLLCSAAANNMVQTCSTCS